MSTAKSTKLATPKTVADAEVVADPPACPSVTVRLEPSGPSDLPTSFGVNVIIRHQVQATSFSAYKSFMDELFARLNGEKSASEFSASASARERMVSVSPPGKIKLHGTIAYDVLRMATEAFLLSRCGPACSDFKADSGSIDTILAESADRVGVPEAAMEDNLTAYLAQYVTTTADGATPYMRVIVEQLKSSLFSSEDKLLPLYRSRYECPDMLELIWSYWHEEGMLSQSMNAIGVRFQNRRSRSGVDPLANLEIDPLRPLNNVLWGWIQSEYKRLSVPRRAYEYDHHYGITLLGDAVPQLRSADSRSKFLESFHSLLALTDAYYKERSDTTRIPDGFPLLNALRETHLILAEGAHNQYGDLPWTSRVEMLVEQWLLARPEVRDFLRGRAMVPYQEAWMSQVDTMKKLQGWTDVGVTHFHELATCGESVLLSIRHGDWANTNDQELATAWADFWRPEVQRYMHAYRAATGVELTQDARQDAAQTGMHLAMPAQLLAARWREQRTGRTA